MLGSRLGIMSSSILTTPITPNDIPNLHLWLDSQDNTTIKNAGGTDAVNDDPVATWEDKSGNLRHFTQTDNTKRPLYKTSGFSNLPSLLFDGVNDDIENTSYNPGVQYFTIFTVHYQLSGNGPVIDLARSISEENFFPRFQIYTVLFRGHAAWNIIPITYNLNKTYISVIKTQELPSSTISLNMYSINGKLNPINGVFINDLEFNGGCRLASRPSDNSWFGGYINEILVYNVTLSDADINGLVQYLINKWNI